VQKTCIWLDERLSLLMAWAEVASAGRDRHVSYKFDVRGHFRRLSDGRLIWVRPHQRCLAHERYIPSVRRVEPEHGR
jgi:hypothetical protein